VSLRYEASAAAAQPIGLTVEPRGVRAPNDFTRALETMYRESPNALLMSDTLTILNRKRVSCTEL